MMLHIIWIIHVCLHSSNSDHQKTDNFRGSPLNILEYLLFLKNQPNENQFKNLGQKEMSGQRESTVSRASASTDLTVRSGLSDIGPRSTATSSVGSSSGILKRDDFEILSYIPDEMTIDDINEQIQAINDANNFLK